VREAIVFVHGLYNLLFQLDTLDMSSLALHPVLIPDLLGYGENAGTSTEISVPTQAQYVKSLLDKAGVERAHFVAHSVGGAVAVILAHQYPHRVASFINVEGNFTLRDAFWSRAIASMMSEEISELLKRYREDPAAWLGGAGIDVTTDRVATAHWSLRLQSAATLQAMARSVVEITAVPSYLEKVKAILDCGIPFHLVAGERSRNAWDVPEFVLQRAASMTIQPAAGHLMMLEDPLAFLKIISRLVG
jgi:lipase